jgi:predicted CoA-substrate-specific enzyme activase
MIGLDLGSRQVKIIQMDGTSIVAKRIYDTIGFYRRFANRGRGTLRLDLETLGFKNSDRVVATGYGKIAVHVEGAVQIPEIQAHVKGAVFQTDRADFTLLDIGGQDTKVIKVRSSRAVDFLTNDRCAASSGRYLENMAAILEISLPELTSYSEDPVELNSTCAIFGETEIIGKIVEGVSLARLAAGVNYTLFRRSAVMLRKMDSGVIVLAGGVAYNQALGEIIARETGRQIEVLAEPQLNGAIGCCLIGQEDTGGY